MEVNLDDIEKSLMSEIEIVKPSPAESKPILPRKKPQVNFKRTPGSGGGAGGASAGYEPDLDAFINPAKSRHQQPMEEEDFGPEGGGPEDFGPETEEYSRPNAVPSRGYDTIEDEKAALLTKIERLKKKGIQGSNRLNIYSDVEELRTEFKRMMYSVDLDQSIKFARRMLVACTTGIEFLNKRFDPFDVKLDGWSETIMENIDDYDGVFEELHNKYKTKIDMAPELKLVMMLGGSAMMFHLTNSMFKSAFPSMNQVVKQNPDLVKNMVDAISKTASANASAAGANGGRPEMRGPGIDLGSLLGGFMGPPPPIVSASAPQQVPIDIDDSVSDIVSVYSEANSTKEISASTGKKRRTKKKEVTI